MKRKPDFFIVGAPKCGTTTLVHSLSQHPDIFMADRELRFFGSDLDFRRVPRPRTSDQYLKAFEKASDKKRLGERSVWYYISERAPHEIKAFDPNAKIIIMLRNPVDMIYSLHSQLFYDGFEELPSFSDALSAEQDRKRGARIPPNVDLVEALFYREVGQYSRPLKRYLNTFGQQHVHVIIFNDLKNDLKKVYRDVCRFLDVNEAFEPEFRVWNPNKRARFGVLNNPPPAALRFAKATIPTPFRRVLRRILKPMNIRYVPRPPMEYGLRRQLQAQFHSDIRELSALLNRDLMHWTRN